MSGGHLTFPIVHVLIIHVRKNVSSQISYFFKKKLRSLVDPAVLAEQFLLPIAKRLP
jgi:hypothetical protein